MPNEEIMNNQDNDRVPRPDPTKLTTEQLTREILSLKENIYARFEAADKIHLRMEDMVSHRHMEIDRQIADQKLFIEGRLGSMDKATILLQDILNQLPNRIDEKLNSLKLLHEEKFISIQTQFRERDVRTEQSSKDSKVAVDAALQAAKEAVGEQNKSSALAIAKSETSTVKQMDQMGTLIASQSKGFDDKFTDVKDRIGRLETSGAELGGRSLRSGEMKKESEWSIGMFIAIGTSMVAAALVIVNILINAYSHFGAIAK